LSGRGLCDELITRPEESYRLWCVVVCDLETSRICAPYIYGISILRIKERRGYSHLQEEALDRTMWRARFGRGFGTVVRQTTK